MRYNISKITLKNRVTIKPESVVSLEVNEQVDIPLIKGIDKMSWGNFYIRKSIARKGVLQACQTPFPQGFNGYPTIVVRNDSNVDIELLAGEEIGSLWIWS